MKLLLLAAAASLGSGFIWFGSRKWLSGEAAGETAPEAVETAALAELSHLWTDDEIEIKDAASLWREKLDGQAATSPRPQFKQAEIDRFYTDPSYHNKMYLSGDHPLIAMLILKSFPEYLFLPYVADGYYTTQVSVVTGGGKRITSLLIPFRTQAFGEMDSTLKLLKTPQLKRMVKDMSMTGCSRKVPPRPAIMKGPSEGTIPAGVFRRGGPTTTTGW